MGGVEVLSYHLLKELSRRGHDILVMTQRAGSDASGRDTFDGLNLVRLDYGLVAIRSRNLSAWRDVSNTVAELVKDFRPDILHLKDTFFSSFF